jgi:hypothetical protein
MGVTMPITYRVAAIALLVLIFGTLGWDYSRQRAALAEARKEAQTAQADLKRLQATSALRERKRVATTAAAASATVSLNTALVAAPEWADTPVPKEIQDALAQ